MPNFRELNLPTTLVADEDDGFEVVRFWIGGGNDHVSLQLLCDDNGKNDLDAWGRVAADIIKHAVRAMRQADPALDENLILATIERAFQYRLKQSTNFSGQLSGNLQ